MTHRVRLGRDERPCVPLTTGTIARAGAAIPASSAPTDRHHLVLYDSVCGLCNRFVQFVLRHDSRSRFRFVALQEDWTRQLLARSGQNPDALDTMGVVTGWTSNEETVLVKSDAALFVLRELGGVWGLVAFGRILPRRFRDWCYDRVASGRYRLFGRFDACPVPTAEQRGRFIL
jgi:predicted DCC family thiol-disulfide oxidoreductase YuxK